MTRNTLDSDQSNYSSRIVFFHIPIEFDQTGISAIRSADLENPTVEPNLKWIGRPLAEIWPFEISPNVKSVVGRSSVKIIKMCRPNNFSGESVGVHKKYTAFPPRRVFMFQVKWIEQQSVRRRQKRDVLTIFNDEKWPQQWPMVCIRM